MADFQEPDLSTIQLDTLCEIKKYCLRNNPFESGGFILKDQRVVCCESFYNDKYNYYPDHSFYLYLTKPDNIAYSFHSHPDSPYPSDNDIFFIKNYDIPIIIYSLKLNVFLSVNIKNEKTIITRFIEETGVWKLDD